MAKIWSRRVDFKHENSVEADMSGEIENVKLVAKCLVFSPNITKTAKKANLPVSTVHDTVRRLDSRYDVCIRVSVKRKVLS